MKKFLKLLLGSVVLFSIGYYCYSSYKKSASLLGVIHVEADSAFKIGIQDIKETLVWDAVTAPKYYYEAIPPSKEDTDDDKEERDNGIEMQPYNLVGFTMPQLKNTLFSIFKIYNSEDFEVFVKAELGKKSVTIQKSDNGNYSFAMLKGNKIALAWNNEQLIATFSPEIVLNKIQTVFSDVLTHEKTITDKEHALVKTLKEEPSHMVYTNGKGVSTINFLDSKVEINGTVFNSDGHVYPKEISLKVNPNASLAIHFDADFEITQQKSKIIENLSAYSFFEKNNLEVAEIVNRTNGFLSVSIAGKTVQKDTIITYGYDDNFEKIEQKSIQEKEVPKININLGSTDESLRDYLTGANTVDENAIFQPFPLYQLYVKESGLYTSFSTYKEGVENTQKKISPNFFDSKVDFNKLQEDLGIPQTKVYFSLLETSRLRAWQTEDVGIKIEGEITGKTPGINILSQIFFGIQKNKETPNNLTDL